MVGNITGKMHLPGYADPLSQALKGLIDNASAARSVNALPIGLSEGCVLRRIMTLAEMIYTVTMPVLVLQ